MKKILLCILLSNCSFLFGADASGIPTGPSVNPSTDGNAPEEASSNANSYFDANFDARDQLPNEKINFTFSPVTVKQPKPELPLGQQISIEFGMTAGRQFVGTFAARCGDKAAETFINALFGNDEQAMQKVVAELQIRKANLQMQEQEQQLKLITELSELISTVRTLNEKATSEKLTEQEARQLQDAKQSLQLLQTVIQQAQN
ncbi:MAG: hypothetical protein WD055_04365 [Candidatus Dependentiae bacterium]